MVKLWNHLDIMELAVLYVYSILKRVYHDCWIIGPEIVKIAVLQLYPCIRRIHGEYGQNVLKHSIVVKVRCRRFTLKFHVSVSADTESVECHLRCWDCSSVRLVRLKILKHCAVSTLTDPWNLKVNSSAPYFVNNGVCSRHFCHIPHEILLIQG